MVGIGSSIGFLIVLGPVIAARALVHVLVGIVGALIVARNRSFHRFTGDCTDSCLGEVIAVLPLGFTSYEAWILVGVGTLLHHSADAAISLAIAFSLKMAGVLKTHPKQA